MADEVGCVVADALCMRIYLDLSPSLRKTVRAPCDSGVESRLRLRRPRVEIVRKGMPLGHSMCARMLSQLVWKDLSRFARVDDGFN